jgi:hypothetical protein
VFWFHSQTNRIRPEVFNQEQGEFQSTCEFIENKKGICADILQSRQLLCYLLSIISILSSAEKHRIVLFNLIKSCVNQNLNKNLLFSWIIPGNIILNSFSLNWMVIRFKIFRFLNFKEITNLIWF